MTPLRPQLDPGSLPHRLRERYRDVIAGARVFSTQLRDDPAQLWHNPLTQVAIWSLVALGGVTAFGLALANFAGSVTLSSDDKPVAILHVACSKPECAHEARLTVSLDFDDWPQVCDKCGRESVYRAQQCPRCKHWFSVAPGQAAECPHCARDEEPAAPTPAQRQHSRDPDDAEDGW